MKISGVYDRPVSVFRVSYIYPHGDISIYMCTRLVSTSDIVSEKMQKYLRYSTHSIGRSRSVRIIMLFYSVTDGISQAKDSTWIFQRVTQR